MKIAVMQPYFFPYIGYFQLVNAVNTFVFYDDVNFIKNGWINRNRILINSNPAYITIQLKNASPFKLINQIQFSDNRAKIAKTIQLAYKKAPYFEQVWPMVSKVLSYQTDYISDLSIKAVKESCKYIGITTDFEVSSKKFQDTKHLDREERLINICKRNNARDYINSINGKELYSKASFAANGINIYFLNSMQLNYKQFNNAFSPNLSIIDVLMFNSKDHVREMICKYELI